jgi:mRNA-degrading endonuclease RelE of RelBE toxin-antitoxin system
MDKNQKFLKRLSEQEFVTVEQLLKKLQKRDMASLDIKKLSGYRDVFRVRSGNIRIIFLDSGSHIEVLEISRRSEKTYRGF